MPDTPIAAGDPAFEERIRQLASRVQSRFRYHSIDLPDGSILPGLQSVEHLRWRLGLFNLPQDLKGKRILDIGAWDGWFSFECERRGAEVVAVDCVALDTFLEAKSLIGSRVEYLTLDVNELSARRLGTFDIVLFFGVLYHLRHPLLGLEKVVELSTDLALIESFVISPEPRAIPAVMEYYERAELGGQIDNWCGPSPECLLSFCRSAGFAQAELLDVTNNRGSVICRRRWPEPPANALPAPELRSAVNNRSWGPKFHPLKDEYLCCFFRSPEANITAENLLAEVDGFGTQTLIVVPDGSGGWQANCLRPPALEPGPHEVRVRIAASARSNAATITMLDDRGRTTEELHAALPITAPELCSVEYRSSGDLRLADSRAGSLVCYFRSPAESIRPRDVVVELDNLDVPVNSVGALEPGVWQANANLVRPPGVQAAARLRLADGAWSERLSVTTAA
jgi:tRNA (mo5U34)-methyltransferase